MYSSNICWAPTLCATRLLEQGGPQRQIKKCLGSQTQKEVMKVWKPPHNTQKKAELQWRNEYYVKKNLTDSTCSHTPIHHYGPEASWRLVVCFLFSTLAGSTWPDTQVSEKSKDVGISKSITIFIHYDQKTLACCYYRIEGPRSILIQKASIRYLLKLERWFSAQSLGMKHRWELTSVEMGMEVKRGQYTDKKGNTESQHSSQGEQCFQEEFAKSSQSRKLHRWWVGVAMRRERLSTTG